MFGSRKYAPFFELCVPKTIFKNWADVFECQELALAAAKAGDLVHFQSKNNRVADALRRELTRAVAGSFRTTHAAHAADAVAPAAPRAPPAPRAAGAHRSSPPPSTTA